METIRYIGVHHSGPLSSNDPNSSSAGLSLRDINLAHQQRWPDFKSALGYWVGYNILIFPDGTFAQTRLIGEETAAQVGHNFDTLAICMVGNYHQKADGTSVDKMTDQTIATLKKIMTAAFNGNLQSLGIQVKPGTKFDLALSRILPHRILQPDHTECYGSSLSDTWARELMVGVIQEEISIATKLLELLTQLQAIYNNWKLGSGKPGRSC